jgi:hypothetical protein
MARQVGNEHRPGPTVTHNINKIVPGFACGAQTMQQKQNQARIASVATDEQSLGGHACTPL